MKAQEANNLSKNKLEGKNSKEYKRVISRVKNEALLGNLFAWIYQKIPSDVENILKEDGYKFSEESNFRNEYLIKISWD